MTRVASAWTLMTRPRPYLSCVTWSCSAYCSAGGAGDAAAKGLVGRRRRAAAREGFITTSMRPGARHYSGSVTHRQPRVSSYVRAALDRDEAVAPVAVEPLHTALRHLDLLVVHAAPRHGRGPRSPPALASLSRTRRGVETVWLANCPAAGTFPAGPASAAGANTREPGARARPGPVLPVPEGDHRRSATTAVMLRGFSAVSPACAAGATPARGRHGSGWPCPREDPGRPQRGRRVPTPAPARRDRWITGETGAAVTHRWACSPRSNANFEPARSSP
jgi:hypothetical protein